MKDEVEKIKGDLLEKVLEKDGLAERVIASYIAEKGFATMKDLLELLAEKGFSRDEAEKFAEAVLRRLVESNRVIKLRDGVYMRVKKIHMPRIRFPFPKRTVGSRPSFKIKQEPSFIRPASSNGFSSNPYWHPILEKDRKAYEKAKKKLGEAADWIA